MSLPPGLKNKSQLLHIITTNQITIIILFFFSSSLFFPPTPNNEMIFSFYKLRPLIFVGIVTEPVIRAISCALILRSLGRLGITIKLNVFPIIFTNVEFPLSGRHCGWCVVQKGSSLWGRWSERIWMIIFGGNWWMVTWWRRVFNWKIAHINRFICISSVLVSHFVLKVQ